MSNKIIDARNKSCPLPLIALKKALKEHKENFTLLINDTTAHENTTRFLKDNGISFNCTEEQGTFSISVGTTLNYQPQVKAETPDTGKHTICIKSCKMGEGSEELGEILLRAFINNLKEVAPLPSAIIFYNSGVKLTLEDSPVVESLEALQKEGVNIFVCGTCVDYYEVKNKVRVGIISNMYEITETLTNASHVIVP